MKPFLDFFSLICPITGDGLIDTVLFFIIGTTSFLIAWILTGLFSDETGCHNSGVMSGIHWFIRITVFLILFGIAIGIVQIVRWYKSWQIWVQILVPISFAVAICLAITFVVLHSRKKPKKSKFR